MVGIFASLKNRNVLKEIRKTQMIFFKNKFGLDIKKVVVLQSVSEMK